MRLFLFWLLILWISLMANRVAVTPIVGGQIVKTVADKPKYPYMVSLQEVRSTNDVHGHQAKNLTDQEVVKYQHFCGGSLINNKWILTAAHCIWIKNTERIVAVIGHDNISDAHKLERYAIQRVEYVYFQPSNYQNDIALLRLQNTYSGPPGLNLIYNYAKVPNYGMKPNRKRTCKIIGYGATQHAGNIQENLIEGEVNVISKKKCRQMLGHIWAPQNGQNTICALGNDQDTCQGDSGGPLICNYNGHDYIYGIVSHGLTCGIKGVPSIYTVTIPYVEWINLIAKN